MYQRIKMELIFNPIFYKHTLHKNTNFHLTAEIVDLVAMLDFSICYLSSSFLLVAKKNFKENKLLILGIFQFIS